MANRVRLPVDAIGNGASLFSVLSGDAKMLHATFMLDECRKVSPALRWAATTCGNWIGAFDTALGRFVPIYGWTLLGKWAGPMTHELCVNGERLSAKYEWVE